MKLHKTIRDMVLLTIPLLLFAALFEPYKWANEKYIVKWFGCAFPKIDAYGNLIDSFNAKDFLVHSFALCYRICGTFVEADSKKSHVDTGCICCGYPAGFFIYFLPFLSHVAVDL